MNWIIPILLVCAVLFFWFAYDQNNRPDITDYNLQAPEVPACTVVQLSDLHSKPSKRILKETAAQKPDIICITGDFINDKNRRRRQMLAYGKALTQLAPVVYIPGNHERRLEDFDRLMQQLADIGFHVLQDKTETIKNISFLGLDENQASFEAYRQRKAGTFTYRNSAPLFQQLADCPGYKIVLSHFPENFAAVAENNYSQYDFDLQLSGHAHGGQWILPGIGPVFSPGQGLRPKYAKGSFGHRPRLIVSRGIGNAEFPLRLFNHPEIVVLHFNKKNNEL